MRIWFSEKGLCMPISYLFIIISGFLLTSLLILILQKLAIKYHFLTSGSIPLIGGIAMGFAFLIICLIFFAANSGLSQGIIGILSASLIMLIFGIIDDWRELSVVAKFTVQIICVAILILFGVRTQIVHIGRIFNIIITFLWIIGVVNALNHLDIMDGLAAGVTAIISLAFFFISILTGNINAAFLSLGLAAVSVTFLRHNLPSARIYMGNAGSHFLGFVLAVVAIMISYASLDRKIALFAPILILGFPIFDTIFLILMRIKQGRSAFKKSKDHLTSRLLKMGYSKNKTLIFLLFLCLFFSFCGITVSRVSNQWSAAIIIAVIIGILILTIKMDKISTDD